MPEQRDLPLSFPELAVDLPLMPVRMVNEYQYCPRLAYLEWVQGEWADSADTVEGTHKHRRVNRPTGSLPPPEDIDDGDRIHARSITLSSSRLGLISRLDLIEVEDGAVTPVDYKRGKRPHVEKGAYEPERVQLCAQGLLLEEHGYECREGVLYFVQSKERVRVEFDAELRSATLKAIAELRLTASGGQIPPPLRDSPKCPRCSLVGICLPDEVNYLQLSDTPPRPLAASKDDALPLYVQARGAKVTKRGETLVVTVDDKEAATARLIEVSQLALFGNVYVTTPCLHELMARGVPVTWYSHGGWFLGHTIGNGHKNVELRTAQYRMSFDEKACLRFAKRLVEAKILNARTLLRRNWKAEDDSSEVIYDLKRDARHTRRASDMQELLGIEGAAASRYFSRFRKLMRIGDGEKEFPFDFAKRNRRPPSDPVNALLSFAYALLVKTWAVTLMAVGLDPFRGLYHQPRYGRPALALDMMEPFRPLLADSSVIQAINNGEIRPTDFVRAAGSVALTTSGRRRFIGTFERRLSQEATHPIFGYRISYRRLIEVQARLLGRFLLGELPEYPNFLTR